MKSEGKLQQQRTVAGHVRNAMAIPLAGVVTVLYVMWQLVAEQQLFLRTFLVERMGKGGVAKLPLGYWNVLVLKSIMLCQHLSASPDTLREARRRTIHKRAKSRVLGSLFERRSTAEREERTIRYVPSQDVN